MIEIPQNVCLDNGVLMWTPVPFADGYSIHDGRDYLFSVSGMNNTEVTIREEIASGDYRVSAYVKNHGTTVQTSKSDIAGLPFDPEVAGLQLILDDRFETLDNWLTKFPYWPREKIINNELQTYIPEALVLTDDGLRIEADRVGDNLWSSGLISGDLETMLFTGGYFEGDIRMDRNTGFLPALWLLNYKYVDKRPEIDIMENPDGRIHSSYHWWEPHRNHNNNDFRIDAPPPDEFHKYGLHWTESRLTWYFDRRPIYTVWGDHIPSQPVYPIINLAVGGDWPGDPDPELESASMDVRSFKVWQ